MKFCIECGTSLSNLIPPGDNRMRAVCSNDACGYIHYVNPKIIVATVPVYQDKVLLCKRAIEPRLGFWTVPAGFMECHETTEQGAIRETLEEACADVSIKQLYRVYDMPYINQVYICYLAELNKAVFAPGEESLDVQLFSHDQIPWSELAFTVMHHILTDYFSELENANFTAKTVTIEKSKL